MPFYPCSVCGSPVEKPYAWRKRIKHVFCCEACQNTPFIEKTCAICGKPFNVTYHNAHAAAYCSDDCRNAKERKWHAAGKYPVVTKVCKTCGKPFEVRRTFAAKQVFCSKQCFWDSFPKKFGPANPRFKGKVAIICAYCGKSFETFPSRAERRKYCCKEHRDLGHAQRLAGDHRTDIEVAMADALRRAKLPFSEQVPLLNRWTVDFLLSDHPIIVQCDGLYWHDRPKTRDRERGQDHYLTNAGYIVLRFTDKQILKHIDACIKTIRRTITNHQLPLIPY